MPKHILDDDPSLPAARGSALKTHFEEIQGDRRIEVHESVLKEAGISVGDFVYCKPIGKGKILIQGVGNNPRLKGLVKPQTV